MTFKVELRGNLQKDDIIPIYVDGKLYRCYIIYCVRDRYYLSNVSVFIDRLPINKNIFQQIILGYHYNGYISPECNTIEDLLKYIKSFEYFNEF